MYIYLVVNDFLNSFDPFLSHCITPGFPEVGFANNWWFVRKLQGVRELVRSPLTN